MKFNGKICKTNNGIVSKLRYCFWVGGCSNSSLKKNLRAFSEVTVSFSRLETILMLTYDLILEYEAFLIK